MKFLLIGCLGLVACQNTTNNGTNTTSVACDPFLRDCPGSNCEQGSVGRLIVIQPGKNTYAYVGTPINITWIYTDNSDNVTYPRNNFVFYYRKKDDTDWKDVGSTPRGNTSTNNFLWNPREPLLKDTRYELLVLADNVSGLINGPGNKPTCFATGFPIGYPEEFVVLNPPSGPSNPNKPDPCSKYCPSESSAASRSVFSYSQFLLYLELLGGLFFLRAF